MIDKESKSETESSHLYGPVHKITIYNSMIIYIENGDLCIGGFSYYNDSASTNLKSIAIDDKFFVENIEIIIKNIFQ